MTSPLSRHLRMIADGLSDQHEKESVISAADLLDAKPGASCSADTTGLPFQKRVVEWLMACFSMEVCRDGVERNHRFLEEALELVQSLGCTRSEAHQLVDYVFNRPVGEPFQELGGSLVTLTALANCHDMDMMEAGETELARVWTKIDKIRAKQAAKPKHSPLPEHVPDAAQQPVNCSQWPGTEPCVWPKCDCAAQPPAAPGCSHPKASFWMERDGETWLICPDCHSKWVKEPAAPVEMVEAGPYPGEDDDGNVGIARSSAVSEPATVDEVLQAARLCLRSNRCLDADRFIARAQAALASAPPQTLSIPEGGK